MKCEGVFKFEGCKRTSCFPFLETLVPVELICKVSIFVKYLKQLFPDNKIFSTATICSLKKSLPTYYNYNNIFLMCNIRSYLGTFGVNSHLLLD